MLAGLGLALRWPRFINLLLWTAMGGAYYWLARLEERRMEAFHGEAYRAYLERTDMFLPGNPGDSLAAALFGWIPDSGRRAFAAWVAALFLALAAAFALRAWSVRQLEVVLVPSRGDILALAPSDYIPFNDLDRIAKKASQDQAWNPDGAALLLYFLRDGGNLEHLLVDSGLSKGFAQGAAALEADYFILAARCRYPCLRPPCPPLGSPREALSPFALRRPVGLYRLPRGGRALERVPWPADAAFGHASVPIL